MSKTLSLLYNLHLVERTLAVAHGFGDEALPALAFDCELLGGGYIRTPKSLNTAFKSQVFTPSALQASGIFTRLLQFGSDVS